MKHDETVLLAKTKLNNIKVLISRALIDSYITLDELLLMMILIIVLLTEDKFMPLKMHLRQLGIAYSASGLFTKNKERIPTFKEAADLRYIYKNQLHNACFQYEKS